MMLIYLILVFLSNESPSQNLSGTVRINTLEYKTLCQCGSESQNSNSTQNDQIPMCQSGSLSIQTSRAGNGYSTDIIKDIIEEPKKHQYIYIKNQSFSCLDGRQNMNGLFTPGGDFGEFLLALHVYEGITENLSYDSIRSLFEAYLDHMDQKYFTYCTDDISLNHIEKEMNKRMTIDRLLEPYLTDKKELMRLLNKSENHGDDHLKLILKYPQYYSVRLDLIQGLIQSFFEILWDKENPRQTKLKIENLSGKHKEGAFVEIRVNEKCQQMGMSPLIRTQIIREEDLQIYVNHVDAIQLRRDYLADFFINIVKQHKDPIDPNVMKNRMNRHGLAFLEITGSFIAKNLPFFTVTLQ